jgi:hypothetical protein
VYVGLKGRKEKTNKTRQGKARQDKTRIIKRSEISTNTLYRKKIKKRLESDNRVYCDS